MGISFDKDPTLSRALSLTGFVGLPDIVSPQILSSIRDAALTLSMQIGRSDPDPARLRSGFTSVRWDLIKLLDKDFAALGATSSLQKAISWLYQSEQECQEAMMHLMRAGSRAEIAWHKEQDVCVDPARISCAVVIYPFAIPEARGVLEILPRGQERGTGNARQIVPTDGFIVLLEPDVLHRVPPVSPTSDRLSIVLRFYRR